MGPVVPLKHLSTTSGSLKRVQNRSESTQIETYTYWDASLGDSRYLFDYIAYIHYRPLVLGPDVLLKHLFTTSGSLKREQNRLESAQNDIYTL